MYDLVIVGGGASGLTASIVSKSKNEKLNILILEKNKEIGKKILASGNGKCNISNINFPEYERIKSYFSSLGLDFITDQEGRCYPLDKKAETVLKVIKNKLREINIPIKYEETVTDIIEKNSMYVVKTNSGEYISKNVVISTGGKSYPSLGTTGDGYVILRKMGHTINTLIPALTKVTVSEDLTKLKGVRQRGKVSLYQDKELLRSEVGEVQFNFDNLSGICIMNLSNLIIRDNSYEILLDPTDNTLHEKLKGNSLTFHVTGLKGWKDAQVTKGGVSLDEINPDTMESRIKKNIYILGETLDYTGYCGGFNLSNAWITGIKFGENFEV